VSTVSEHGLGATGLGSVDRARADNRATRESPSLECAQVHALPLSCPRRYDLETGEPSVFAKELNKGEAGWSDPLRGLAIFPRPAHAPRDSPRTDVLVAVVSQLAPGSSRIIPVDRDAGVHSRIHSRPPPLTHTQGPALSWPCRAFL
jgi:hypothetical protein